MMRLNRAGWLQRWTQQGRTLYCRGIGGLRRWMSERGYVEDAGPYSLRVTVAGYQALTQAVAEHARHGRTVWQTPESRSTPLPSVLEPARTLVRVGVVAQYEGAAVYDARPSGPESRARADRCARGLALRSVLVPAGAEAEEAWHRHWGVYDGRGDIVATVRHTGSPVKSGDMVVRRVAMDQSWISSARPDPTCAETA